MSLASPTIQVTLPTLESSEALLFARSTMEADLSSPINLASLRSSPDLAAFDAILRKIRPEPAPISKTIVGSVGDCWGRSSLRNMSQYSFPSSNPSKSMSNAESRAFAM
ncbi:hypothetical protein H113_03482 [Trichophyton rubrum MR1459]|uniref:Uncharacterized protein n=1 Tax=Trichophyton rubrum (strain ATCC MYA-4607 / CBS 118892) TaxID=559305 RepID=A0A080WLP7_TRIRC|nr:uncharacterized protein TERG_12188 [Trichophyton rubrum CBS 118892]EZF96283.1 hypothetical protein H113_03482 [Trichophyton rubrum MR1459]EZG07143.1 hypothetical protein H106_03272 [Trichophyton rubrum CBS 735.88]KFL61737.1 hypothetical protein TERG_12188 [Trichophyton rubrum CBS 118892]